MTSFHIVIFCICYHKVGLYIRLVLLSFACRVKGSLITQMLNSGGFLHPGRAEISLAESLQGYECHEGYGKWEVIVSERIYSAPGLFVTAEALFIVPWWKLLSHVAINKNTRNATILKNILLEQHVVLLSVSTDTCVYIYVCVCMCVFSHSLLLANISNVINYQLYRYNTYVVTW
jgi:hypothetical protein